MSTAVSPPPPSWGRMCSTLGMTAAQASAGVCAVCGTRLPSADRLPGIDRMRATPGTFSVLVCGECGAGNTRPRASAEELASYYPGAYGPYELPRGGPAEAVSQAIRAWQGRRALRTAPLEVLSRRPPGRVFDVGCGRGDTAELLARRGWRAAGIEPSEAALAVAAE